MTTMVLKNILKRYLLKNKSKRFFSSECDENQNALLDLNCKSAAIFGGTGGIGYATAHQLLQNKLCHVALIDQDITCGREAVSNLNCAYGKDKAMFIRSDVLDKKDVSSALKVAQKEFKGLDIIVNTVGVWDDCHWNDEVDLNLRGTINVILSSQEVACSKQNVFLLNFCGLQGLEAFPPSPTISASFAGSINFCRSYGHPFNYEKSKMRLVTLCTGLTQTNFTKDVPTKALNAEMSHNLETYFEKACWQKADVCGKSAIQLAKFGMPGTVYVIEGSRLFLVDIIHWKRSSILVTQFV